jgi:hypothetical protein
MTYWQASKYESLLILQNYVAKNCLWRSAAANSPSSNSSATTENRGKAPMPKPSYKHHHGGIGQSIQGSHNNFVGNRSKGASSSKINWGHLKDEKSVFKSPLKSYNIDKKVNHKKATSGSRIYDSWNNAKAKFIEDDFNKRRRTNACINCASLIVPSQNPDCLRVL